MRRGIWVGLVVVMAGLGLTAGARGDFTAHLEFINTGTPRNGSVEMTGWYGVIVRVVSDQEKPITHLDFGPYLTGYMKGCIAQRWTDPALGGNYSQTSPGLKPANNSFPSVFNFDSHFLDMPGLITNTQTEGLGLFPFRTDRVPIHSTLSVGYGATTPAPYTDGLGTSEGGWMAGQFDFDPAFGLTSIDAAYIVTESAFGAGAGVLVSGESYGYVTGTMYVVPEPGSVGLIGVWMVLMQPRRCVGKGRRELS